MSKDVENFYEVEFCYNVFGDVYGEFVDGLVVFNLDFLFDIEGKIVKLKLKWKLFNGEKIVEFDYCICKLIFVNSVVIIVG